MNLTAWIGQCVRKRADRTGDQHMRHLLSAVDPVAPPEGLLRDIERCIDAEAPARSAWSWVARPAFAAVAIAVLVVPVILLMPSEQGLLDPSGREVAVLAMEGGTAVIRSKGGSGGGGQMAWHLWGVGKTETPVYLGRLDRAGVSVPDLQQFTGFAISLEAASFAGDRPLGPVVPLILEN